MSDLLLSTIEPGSVIALQPASDRLVFDDPAISATQVAIGFDPFNLDQVILTVGEASYALLGSISIGALTSANFVFADGSRLIIGDDASSGDDIFGNLLTGGAGNDQLLGLAGSDTLVGGLGADLLVGGPGSDTMWGGLGVDTYIVDHAGDVVLDRFGPETQTVRVSTRTDGSEIAGTSWYGVVSPDGRQVVFNGLDSSVSPNAQLYSKDLSSGQLRLVSASEGGVPGNVFAEVGGIWSPDGSSFAFNSRASNLGPPVPPDSTQVYVKDVVTGALQLVSADYESGSGAAGQSNVVDWSPSGLVVFTSTAANLVAGDSNGTRDVFVRDLSTGTTRMVSVDAAAQQGGDASEGGSITADGRWVAFSSLSSNLVAGDGNGYGDVFVKDLQDGSIERISLSAGGQEANGPSHSPAISPDGRTVLFVTEATSLTGTGGRQIVSKDLVTGEIQVVTVRQDGQPISDLSAFSYWNGIAASSDLRYVAYMSSDDGIVPGDEFAGADIFVTDRLTGETRLVSRGVDGAQGATTNYVPSISGDGRYVTFESEDAGLAPGDGDASYDVFRVRNPLFDDGAVDEVVSEVSFTLGDALENLVLTGTAGLSGSGNALANRITGNTGPNLLSGAAGPDTLDGGAGADTLAGGRGNDTYLVGVAGDVVDETAPDSGGTDTVRSSVDWVLGSNVENLVLLGGAGLSGTGNAQANRITGNAGANALSGAGGNDTLAGAGGDDTYVVDAPGDVVDETASGSGGTDTVRSSVNWTLGTNVENLVLLGSAGLSGTGNGLANRIEGNGGANRLDGRGGSDVLKGGAGNDTYVVDGAGDVVEEAANAGTDVVESIVHFSLASLPHVEHVTLKGGGNINATGNSLNNVLTGNAGSNVLDGGGGVDTVSYAAAAVGVQVSLAVSEAQNTGAGTDRLISIEALVGSGLADTLNGNPGANTLDGGAGNDALFGFGGDDVYVVDAPADAVFEVSGAGYDVVRTWVTYALPAHVEELQLLGSAGIGGTGNSQNNVLVGNGGNNVLQGGDGLDTVSYRAASQGVTANLATGVATGAGTDTLVEIENLEGSAHADRLTGDAGFNRLSGGGANDSITGGDNQDTLLGGPGNDTLVGGNGNDSLQGDAGIDSMTGGGGDDTYVVDVASDKINEVADGGTEDSVRSSIDFVLPANLEYLVLLDGALQGEGNTGANKLTGNAANNTLRGGDGSDTLDGGAGADSLYGGSGSDVFNVDDPQDRVFENSGAGTDAVEASVSFTLPEHVENLRLSPFITSPIDGVGNGAANKLYGNDGDNRLDGGAGGDLMEGRRGNDVFVVDSTQDLVVEALGEGVDLVESRVAYQLPSNVERLLLTGGASISGTGNELDNRIVGNGGANSLVGLAGRDTLDGGLGVDRLNGGGGNDTFRFTTAPSGSTNVDRVADFDPGIDRLELDNAVFAKLGATGALKPALFRANATGVAADSNDYVTYETDTGILRYDADGSGVGAAVVIATFDTVPSLTAGSLFVI